MIKKDGNSLGLRILELKSPKIFERSRSIGNANFRFFWKLATVHWYILFHPFISFIFCRIDRLLRPLSMDDSERYPLIRGVPQWYDGPVPVNNVAADTPDITTSKSEVFNVDF